MASGRTFVRFHQFSYARRKLQSTHKKPDWSLENIATILAPFLTYCSWLSFKSLFPNAIYIYIISKWDVVKHLCSITSTPAPDLQHPEHLKTLQIGSGFISWSIHCFILIFPIVSLCSQPVAGGSQGPKRDRQRRCPHRCLHWSHLSPDFQDHQPAGILAGGLGSSRWWEARAIQGSPNLGGKDPYSKQPTSYTSKYMEKVETWTYGKKLFNYINIVHKMLVKVFYLLTEPKIVVPREAQIWWCDLTSIELNLPGANPGQSMWRFLAKPTISNNFNQWLSNFKQFQPNLPFYPIFFCWRMEASNFNLWPTGFHPATLHLWI